MDATLSVTFFYFLARDIMSFSIKYLCNKNVEILQMRIYNLNFQIVQMRIYIQNFEIVQMRIYIVNFEIIQLEFIL